MNIKCPECKKSELKKFGLRWKKKDGKRIRIQQYQCNTCGRIFIQREK
jgi:YgiT-type zinc finger domain-containing protein